MHSRCPEVAFSPSQTHGLRPCDPKRLGRSGEPLKDSATRRESSSGLVSVSESGSVFQYLTWSSPISKADPDSDSDPDPENHRSSPCCARQAKATPSWRGRLHSTIYWGYQKKNFQIWYFCLDSGPFCLVFAHYKFLFLQKAICEKRTAKSGKGG